MKNIEALLKKEVGATVTIDRVPGSITGFVYRAIIRNRLGLELVSDESRTLVEVMAFLDVQAEDWLAAAEAGAG